MAVVNYGRFRDLAGRAITVLVIVFLLVAQIVLYGERFSAAGLVLVSVGVLVAGFLLRAAGGASRPVGSAVALIGAVAIALALGLAVLLLAGWGRGY